MPEYTAAEANLRPAFGLQLRGGGGVDHLEAVALLRQNEACAGYAIVRPAGPLFLGAEFRRLRTGYAATRYESDHVTLAAGFEF